MAFPSKSKIFFLGNASAQLFIACLYYHWCGQLPAPGKAVLVIGVVAVLMTFDMGVPLKGACLALVFALAFLENKSIDKDRSLASGREATLMALATNTDNVATQTIAGINVLKTQVSSQGSDLDRKIEAAAKGNPQLISSLKAQATAERAQADAASKQLLQTMVSAVASSLIGLGQSWYFEEDNIVNANMMAKPRLSPTAQAEKIAALNRKYLEQAKPLMLAADSLRQQLLQRLPSPQTLEDQKGAKIFARGDAIYPMEVRDAGYYLWSLSGRAGIVPVSP